MAGTRAKPDLRTVTIAIVRDGAEVQAMQTKLRAAGIESFLTSERSYAVKKSHDLAAQHQPRLIHSLSDRAASNKESGAVKVQVARSDVERALSILGAANVSVSQRTHAEVIDAKSGNAAPRFLKDRDPTVPIIVVVFVVVAALILAIS